MASTMRIVRSLRQHPQQQKYEDPVPLMCLVDHPPPALPLRLSFADMMVNSRKKRTIKGRFFNLQRQCVVYEQEYCRWCEVQLFNLSFHFLKNEFEKETQGLCASELSRVTERFLALEDENAKEKREISARGQNFLEFFLQLVHSVQETILLPEAKSRRLMAQSYLAIAERIHRAGATITRVLRRNVERKRRERIAADYELWIRQKDLARIVTDLYYYWQLRCRAKQQRAIWKNMFDTCHQLFRQTFAAQYKILTQQIFEQYKISLRVDYFQRQFLGERILILSECRDHQREVILRENRRHRLAMTEEMQEVMWSRLQIRHFHEADRMHLTNLVEVTQREKILAQQSEISVWFSFKVFHAALRLYSWWKVYRLKSLKLAKRKLQEQKEFQNYSAVQIQKVWRGKLGANIARSLFLARDENAQRWGEICSIEIHEGSQLFCELLLPQMEFLHREDLYRQGWMEQQERQERILLQLESLECSLVIWYAEFLETEGKDFFTEILFAEVECREILQRRENLELQREFSFEWGITHFSKCLMSLEAERCDRRLQEVVMAELMEREWMHRHNIENHAILFFEHRLRASLQLLHRVSKGLQLRLNLAQFRNFFLWENKSRNENVFSEYLSAQHELQGQKWMDEIYWICFEKRHEGYLLLQFNFSHRAKILMTEEDAERSEFDLAYQRLVELLWLEKVALQQASDYRHLDFQRQQEKLQQTINLENQEEIQRIEIHKKNVVECVPLFYSYQQQEMEVKEGEERNVITRDKVEDEHRVITKWGEICSVFWRLQKIQEALQHLIVKEENERDLIEEKEVENQQLWKEDFQSGKGDLLEKEEGRKRNEEIKRFEAEEDNERMKVYYEQLDDEQQILLLWEDTMMAVLEAQQKNEKQLAAGAKKSFDDFFHLEESTRNKIQTRWEEQNREEFVGISLRLQLEYAEELERLAISNELTSAAPYPQILLHYELIQQMLIMESSGEEEEEEEESEESSVALPGTLEISFLRADKLVNPRTHRLNTSQEQHCDREEGPNPYIVVKLMDNTVIFRSSVQSDTLNPIWDPNKDMCASLRVRLGNFEGALKFHVMDQCHSENKENINNNSQQQQDLFMGEAILTYRDAIQIPPGEIMLNLQIRKSESSLSLGVNEKLGTLSIKHQYLPEKDLDDSSLEVSESSGEEEEEEESDSMASVTSVLWV